MPDVITFVDEGEQYVTQLLKDRFDSGDVKIFCMNAAGFAAAGAINFGNLTSNTYADVYSEDPPTVPSPEIIDGDTGYGYATLSVTLWRAKNHGDSSVTGFGWVAVDVEREKVIFVTPFVSVFGVGAGETIDVTLSIRCKDESQP